MSKILTVFGATGNQGGALVRTVLANPQLSQRYQVRAVTRDPSKANAQKLRDLGVEVVQGDQNDAASLRTAVKGSYAVFGVTNFWEGMDGSQEEAQGKAMADAAVAEGVTFFLFSSLPHTSRVTKGVLTHIKHFEHKANVEEYVKTLPIKSAFFWPSFFMGNFLGQFGPQKGPDGQWALTANWTPDTKVPLINIDDAGLFMTPALLDPEAYHHRRIYGASAFYTPTDIVATWNRVLGSQVKFQQVPDDVYKGFLPAAMAVEMMENNILIREYKYFGDEGQGAEAELAETLKSLPSAPTPFEDYVKMHRDEWAFAK